jgi:ribosomal protein S18 acetylase RimI-like enzyme
MISDSMHDIAIKKVSPADIELLQGISRQTFYETFADKNTEEDMKQYLDKSFNADTIASEVEDPNSQFYFALHNNKIAGYLKLNTGQAQTELKDETALEIERIYVLQEYQSKKVGQILFNKALEIANERHARYIWLGVWEENAKALRFYKKNGFMEFGKHSFLLGNDKQTDILMKRNLS